MKVNKKRLLLEIQTKSTKLKAFQNAVKGVDYALQAKFYALKNKFLLDLMNSPVCQDLMNKKGNSAKVIYGVRTGKGDSPSLFGVLGFDAHLDPVGDLIDFLDRSIQYKNIKMGLLPKIFTTGAVVELQLPNTDDVRNATKSQLGRWSNLSWVFAIEKGDISNIKLFLSSVKDLGYSASGEGIQVKNVVSPRATFRPTKFLSPLLRSFLIQSGKIASKL